MVAVRLDADRLDVDAVDEGWPEDGGANENVPAGAVHAVVEKSKDDTPDGNVVVKPEPEPDPPEPGANRFEPGGSLKSATVKVGTLAAVSDDESNLGMVGGAWSVTGDVAADGRLGAVMDGGANDGNWDVETLAASNL